MADDSRESRPENAPVFLAWGMPLEAREGAFDEPALWLSGGACLLLWTALVLVLTSV